MWLVLAGRCPLPSCLRVIPEEDLRLSEKEIAQLYLSWGVQLPRNLLEKRIIPLVEGNPLGARLLAMEMSQGSSYTEELMNDLTRKFYEYLNQAIYTCQVTGCYNCHSSFAVFEWFQSIVYRSCGIRQKTFVFHVFQELCSFQTCIGIDGQVCACQP